MEMWVLSVVGGGLFLALVGRYNAELVLRRWEALLSPAALDALRRLEERVELDSLLAARAHRQAGRAMSERRLAEASRLVALAASVVHEAVPDRLARLRGMAVCCRMASALLVMPPLVPGAFRLREIATLAGLSSFLHHILVAAAERFRLRLWTLEACYRVVRGVSAGSSTRLQSDPSGSRPWESFAAALHDFAALDREHIEAFRVLLLALQNAPVEDARAS